MSVWNHQVEEDQNVDLICSDIVACCVITEDTFLRGHQFIQEKVSYLQDFPKGIVFLVSSSLHSNTDEIQLILHKMKLQAFPVASLDRAAECAERLRKMGNSNPKITRKKSELSATPPVEALSSINNVSRKRAQALLESVGSCKKIAVEPESEIAAVKGIGRSAASSINEFFQSELN
jgi:ERCC4-type nuclease